MVLVRKLCKIWTFGDESSKPVFEQKPVFFRRFSWKTEPAQSVRDLTFGTEGWRFESSRVYFFCRFPRILSLDVTSRMPERRKSD